MKNKRGYVFMILGVLLVVGAVVLSFYNNYDDKRAGDESVRVYDALYDEIEKNTKNSSDDSGNEPLIPEDMKTVTVEGREYIGAISIPAMKVKLPIQSDLLDEEKLRYSPCRYKGNVFENSLIIAAHNYRTHFGRLATLKNGDKVTFTDVDGHNYNYKVLEIYYLDSTSVAEMEAPGNWDLTLFTCTYGNRQRITVRCVRTEKD